MRDDGFTQKSNILYLGQGYCNKYAYGINIVLLSTLQLDYVLRF